METILYNVSQVVGISILHSLWQGMIVYIVLRLVYIAIPSITAEKKYNIALFALTIISLSFIYTLYAEADRYTWSGRPMPVHVLLQEFGMPQRDYAGFALPAKLSMLMPYIFAGYVAGIVINLLKLNWEWNRLRKLKNSLMPAEQMQQFILRLAQKLYITKSIRINFSGQIDVPCVIGWLKPVIILPATLSVHLSACEIKAILLHELAHIRRNDYLVNLLQQALSVILFFNPFIYIVNRVINQERENSCDDLVVARTGNPLIYAQALLKLEQTRTSYSELVLAATGKKFHLLNRIERIMKTQKQIGNIRHLFIGVLLLVLSAGSLAWLNPADAGKLKQNQLKTRHRKSDTAGYVMLTDTPKHKHKPVMKNSKASAASYAVKKERRAQAGRDSLGFDSLTDFYHSKAWQQQMAAISKEGDELRKQFDNPQWKKQMADMKLQALAMQNQFDSPGWKSQMDAIRKQGDDMKKQFESPEWKKEMKAMKLQSLALQKQFNSPQWKLRMDSVSKQFHSPEWQKQMEAVKLQSLAIQKQFNNPEWKKQIEVLKNMTEKMQQQFNTPAWQRQMEQLQKSSEKWGKMMQDDSARSRDILRPQQDTVAKKIERQRN